MIFCSKHNYVYVCERKYCVLVETNSNVSVSHLQVTESHCDYLSQEMLGGAENHLEVWGIMLIFNIFFKSKDRT